MFDPLRGTVRQRLFEPRRSVCEKKRTDGEACGMERKMNVVLRGSYFLPGQEQAYCSSNTATSPSDDSPCSSPVDKKFDLRRMSPHENCTFSGNGRGQAALSYTSPSVKLLLFLLLLLPNAFFVNCRASAEQIREGEAASRSSNDGVVEELRGPPAPPSSGQHAVELNKSPRRGPASTSTSYPVLDSSLLVQPAEMLNKTPPPSTSSVLEVELQEKEEENEKLLVDTAKHKQAEQQRTGEAEAKIDRAKLNQHEAAHRVTLNEQKQMATASTKAETAQQEEKSTRKKSEQQQKLQKLQKKGKHQAGEQKTTAQERRIMNREQRNRAKEQLAEVARAKQMAKQGARQSFDIGGFGDDVYNHIEQAWDAAGEKAWDAAMDATNLKEHMPGEVYEGITDWWNNDVWTIDNAHEWWQDEDNADDHNFQGVLDAWNGQEDMHDKVGQVATVAGTAALGVGAIGLAARGSGKKDTTAKAGAKGGGKGKGSKAAGMPKEEEQSEEQGDGDNSAPAAARAEAAPPSAAAAAPAEPSAVEQREPPAGEAAPVTPSGQDQPDKQQPGGAVEAADDEELPPEDGGGSGGEEDAEPVSRKSSRKKKSKNAREEPDGDGGVAAGEVDEPKKKGSRGEKDKKKNKGKKGRSEDEQPAEEVEDAGAADVEDGDGGKKNKKSKKDKSADEGKKKKKSSKKDKVKEVVKEVEEKVKKKGDKKKKKQKGASAASSFLEEGTREEKLPPHDGVLAGSTSGSTSFSAQQLAGDRTSYETKPASQDNDKTVLTQDTATSTRDGEHSNDVTPAAARESHSSILQQHHPAQEEAVATEESSHEQGAGTAFSVAEVPDAETFLELQGGFNNDVAEVLAPPLQNGISAAPSTSTGVVDDHTTLSLPGGRDSTSHDAHDVLEDAQEPHFSELQSTPNAFSALEDTTVEANNRNHLQNQREPTTTGASTSSEPAASSTAEELSQQLLHSNYIFPTSQLSNPAVTSAQTRTKNFNLRGSGKLQAKRQKIVVEETTGNVQLQIVPDVLANSAESSTTGTTRHRNMVEDPANTIADRHQRQDEELLKVLGDDEEEDEEEEDYDVSTYDTLLEDEENNDENYSQSSLAAPKPTATIFSTSRLGNSFWPASMADAEAIASSCCTSEFFIVAALLLIVFLLLGFQFSAAREKRGKLERARAVEQAMLIAHQKFLFEEVEEEEWVSEAESEIENEEQEDSEEVEGKYTSKATATTTSSTSSPTSSSSPAPGSSSFSFATVAKNLFAKVFPGSDASSCSADAETSVPDTAAQMFHANDSSVVWREKTCSRARSLTTCGATCDAGSGDDHGARGFSCNVPVEAAEGVDQGTFAAMGTTNSTTIAQELPQLTAEAESTSVLAEPEPEHGVEECPAAGRERNHSCEAWL
ncbi:unnamed protein product [Amoebophrya sp. A120]|nr:unnamed protein product [Amoebophrya sp. A120]|eukprot:GSA120T00024267001.1